jgi:hypothetical protein
MEEVADVIAGTFAGLLMVSRAGDDEQRRIR